MKTNEKIRDADPEMRKWFMENMERLSGRYESKEKDIDEQLLKDLGERLQKVKRNYWFYYGFTGGLILGMLLAIMLVIVIARDGGI